MRLRVPAPLRAGGRIGVTSPSAGVGERAQPRIDHAVEVLRARGYEVVVGGCMAADRWVRRRLRAAGVDVASVSP